MKHQLFAKKLMPSRRRSKSHEHGVNVRRYTPTQSNTVNIVRQNFEYYGKYKLILFKVNGEYIDLFNNRGQSSLNLTNPPTNVTNGFGVFIAMNVDTLDFTVLK